MPVPQLSLRSLLSLGLSLSNSSVHNLANFGLFLLDTWPSSAQKATSPHSTSKWAPCAPNSNCRRHVAISRTSVSSYHFIPLVVQIFADTELPDFHEIPHSMLWPRRIYNRDAVEMHRLKHTSSAPGSNFCRITWLGASVVRSFHLTILP